MVMSDWWAVHAAGYQDAGLDLDMPGTDGWFSSSHLSASDPARVDDMAERVLAPMVGVGVAQITGTAPYNCVPPNCDDLYYHANASSDAHVALARRAAAGESLRV